MKKETKLPCRFVPDLKRPRRAFDAVAHLVEQPYREGFAPWFGTLLDVPLTMAEVEELVQRPMMIAFEDGRQGLAWHVTWEATVVRSKAADGAVREEADRTHIFFMGLTHLAKPPAEPPPGYSYAPPS
jgi:hypothetical protein